MIVRSGTAEDVPGVLPLVRAICDLHAQRDPERFAVRPDVLESYARWLPERASDPRSVFLVAEHPAVTGLAAYAVCTTEPEIPIFWIPECGMLHDIYVVPEVRGHGVASAMVREVIARFKAIGVKQIRLHTGVFNTMARSLFESEGFRPSVIEMLRPL